MIPHWRKQLLFTAATLLTQLAFASTNSVFVSDAKGHLSLATTCETRTENFALPGRLSSLGENVIEIKDQTLNFQVDRVTFPLKGTFWQVSGVPNTPQTLNCSDASGVKKYLLFDVFVPEQLAPVAQVGISTDQDVIFQSIALHTPEEAEKLIATRPLQVVATTPSIAKATSLTAGVTAVEGTLNYIACISGNTLNVRDETLSKVLFTVARHDRALPVQSFGTDKMEKVISGVTYRFIKVQFPERTLEPNIGWVAQDYIKLTSQCSNYIPPSTPAPVPAPNDSSSTGRVDGWVFPTFQRPTDSYKTGQRRFSAARDGGNRLHAACDLYRLNGEQIGAVSDGKIIRSRYFFYQGTYAIEVQHTGGKVVRYGEVTGKSAPNTALGASVAAGQIVGYVGTVNSGCCKPMLHYEMYTGTATGPLTTGGNKYNRRKDLMDPTDLLSTWEKAKFGQSY